MPPQVLRVVNQASRSRQTSKEVCKQALKRLRPMLYDAVARTSPVMLSYPSNTLESRIELYIRQGKDDEGFKFRYSFSLVSDQQFDSCDELHDRRVETCRIEDILKNPVYQEQWQKETDQICSEAVDVLEGLIFRLEKLQRRHIHGSVKTTFTIRNGKFSGVSEGSDRGAQR